MQTCSTILSELRSHASVVSKLGGDSERPTGDGEDSDRLSSFNRRLDVVEETNRKIQENLVEIQAWIEGAEKNQEWMAWVTERLAVLEK